ncbi:hypothetical protein C0995_004801 [Termitomyces sp. Mi166|nr:hypothetical protein C0995_004801 [Termitomyces sp. Mi166\
MTENSGARRKARKKSRSSMVPMSGDRIFNTADPTGLISPPPEETLQSKRKRTTPTPTPNPKPRKQSRRPSALDSPTRHTNPNADYLPTRTRRTTPIPAYEPPTDVFTPPRVVVMTPTISKSSKRKTTNRNRAASAELLIKTEFDLSAPMPPASPTDDPLLLSAASSSPLRPRRRDPALDATPRSLPPAALDATPRSLPPSSPPADDTDNPFEWPQDSTSPRMEVDAHHPVFDVTDPSVGAWSDSDDDAGAGEGEYTGHFRSFSVRTKLDPPSSATRKRQEDWGRPITPFPFRKLGRLREEEDVEMEHGPMGPPEETSLETSRDDQDEEEERQVREMSLSLDDEPQAQAAPGWSPHQLLEASFDSHLSLAQQSIEPAYCGPFDFDTSFEEDGPVEQQTQAQDQSITIEEDPKEADRPIEPLLHDEEADERQVREMSLSLDDDDNDEPNVIATPAPASPKPLTDEDSSSDEEELEYGVVKISSADPHAAARAAAILKQHDYDCFTKLALRAQKGRRHSLFSSGITKTRTPRDPGRRRTLGASVIGDKVFIPGSPTTTLPELLKQAEATVSGTPVTPHLFTPVPRASTVGFARSLFENAGKEKVWTKEEWKLLDACFTDERISLGPGDGELASVDRVLPENVARRFVDLLGGDGVVGKWGGDWETENLLQRVKALQNKQRKGIVAPPTTPNTPRTTTGPSASMLTRRIPSMEVPDFTPLGRRAAPPGRRPMLPPPVVVGAPFSDLQDTPDQEQERSRRNLPLPLLAPRYSHLLEEAVAVSQLPDPESQPERAYDPSNQVDSEEDAEANAAANTSTETVPPVSIPAPSSTLKTRVKGFLFSYLPILSKTPAPKSKPSSTRPGLPLPPVSVLEKGLTRGPITTPARAPMPKPTHPKELVHLVPAPLPPKPSMIPRPQQKPQRLVELHRVSPPPEKEKGKEVVRPRRSSGGSVKDLVRGFEEMEKKAEEQKRGELKRVRSVGEWRKTAGLAQNGSNKPSWRP